MYRGASQKKTLFWKSRYSTEYKCDLYLDGNKYIIDDPNDINKGELFRFLLPITSTRPYHGKKVSGSIKNFTSGCCYGVYSSVDFTLDFTHFK